jgi:protein regulator of cytokinesis 1
MERSMADDEYEEEEDEDHQITLPLLKCLQGLKERHKAAKKRYADRYDSVKRTLCMPRAGAVLASK